MLSALFGKDKAEYFVRNRYTQSHDQSTATDTGMWTGRLTNES